MKSETIVSEIVTRLTRFSRFMLPEAREQFTASLDETCERVTSIIEHDRADELDKAVFSMLPKALDAIPAEPKPEDFANAIQVLKQMATAYLADKETGLGRKITIEGLQKSADEANDLSDARAAEIVRLTVELETANERLRLSEMALGAAIQRLDTAKEKARDYVREIGDKARFSEIDAL